MVSVFSSTAAASGLSPTLALATTWQSVVTAVLHVEVLIRSISCVRGDGGQPMGHCTGTYRVPVLGLTAGTPGLPLMSMNPRWIEPGTAGLALGVICAPTCIGLAIAMRTKATTAPGTRRPFLRRRPPPPCAPPLGSQPEPASFPNRLRGFC